MIIELPLGRFLDSSSIFSHIRSIVELCALRLTHLDCSSNRLVRLPLNLREMVTLIEFHVEHNPLEIPPASVGIFFFFVEFHQ